MTSGGVERKFQLTVPPNYDGRKPFPVLFGLHALSISNTVRVGHDGVRRHGAPVRLHRGRAVGAARRHDPVLAGRPARDNYDVRFIGDLLDKLEREMCVDRARVYSTGMSNGAQMSSLLACRIPNRIAAVAPVAGVEFSDTCRGRPVPVIAFHGTADPIVTYEGGGLNAARIADVDYWKGNVPPGLPQHHGVDAAMQTWAKHNGCDAKPVEERVAPEVRRRTWQHCKADTILYVDRRRRARLARQARARSSRRHSATRPPRSTRARSSSSSSSSTEGRNCRGSTAELCSGVGELWCAVDFEREVVDVAVPPVFTRFVRLDDGVVFRTEMRSRMTVR